MSMTEQILVCSSGGRQYILISPGCVHSGKVLQYRWYFHYLYEQGGSPTPPAIAPLARMRCSSSERVINLFSFLWIEYARERGRLPQAHGFVRKAGYKCGNIRPGLIKNFQPLFYIGRRRSGCRLTPACQISPWRLKQVRMLIYLSLDLAMQRQASGIENAMI
jgi:hypothetical protein